MARLWPWMGPPQTCTRKPRITEHPSTRPDRRTPRSPRHLVTQTRMSGTRMQHLRCPPILPHSLIRLLPRRQRRLTLRPVRHRSLIAPVQKLRHGRLVGPGDHVCPHGRLALPRRHRPESPVAVRQQRPTLKSRRLPDLALRANRIQKEPRHEPHRPHPQPRQADKNHRHSRQPS
jgi:hypothetical protein